ncbi:molybdopterin cofactor-binding domain-containing protein [Gemmatimonadota bacterium]
MKRDDARFGMLGAGMEDWREWLASDTNLPVQGEWDQDGGFLPLDRRRFLKVAGGGVTVFFTVGLPLKADERDDTAPDLPSPQRGGYPSDFNAYLRVQENGWITLFTGKIEQGQGAITALPLMLAEEMDVPVSSVDIVLGDTDLCPWDMGTFGSLCIRMFGPALRTACAEARAVLLELASERLSVPADRLAVSDGRVHDRGSPSRSVTYAELARGRRIERHVQGAEPKHHSEYTISGKPTLRRDSREKVTGEAKFAGDMLPDGLLHAKILRPPAHRARRLSLDTGPARRIEGVRVIEDGDMVAVLHERPDVAERALALVEAEWEITDSTPTHISIFDHLVANSPEGSVYQEEGELGRGRSLATRTVESTYYNHYVAHAPMEPHTATAHVEGDRATVWPATQTPFGAQSQVARALGFPPENVRIITPFVGGGFGGKTANRQVTEAARLSQLAGAPVQVAWSRKEEFFYDSYRPAAVVKFSSGMDADNRIVFWDYDNFFGGTRSSEVFYNVPNYRVFARGGWQGGNPAHPFAVGAWRGPASCTNAFAMELQMDIMAEAAGMNPLDFRLHNLTNERMRRVLTTASEAFGHSFQTGSSGRGYGLACTDYHGTYVALMAEVEVNRSTGHVQVKRVVCAQDMGECVNPQGALLQIEGCILMGLGYTLSEEIHFEGGQILDENFGTYGITRFSWVPEIEAILIENQEMDPQGGGEPAITAMGAVVANAIYDAVGARCYTLPMTPERVLSAMG